MQNSGPRLTAISLLVLGSALLCSAADYPVQPVPFTSVRITGGMWQERQETNRLVTVPYALQQCEISKRLLNFDLAAETMKRRAAGETNFQNKPQTIYPFDDSDVYKAIEGASFALSIKKDPQLEAKLDSFIAKIAAAQEPDGYIYTFRTMHPDSPAHEWINQKRWLNDPLSSHEMYNIGHMYKAGVAYYQATGKRNFLDICLKSAELVNHDFGKGELRIAPGHQVIEMGLVKLYRATGDPRYLKLAKFFLDVRGPGQDPYNQRHLRVVEQTEAVGHAVRANYMYSGMADVAALTGDESYLNAINKIWDNVVGKKLHLTGGVGARAAGEAFGDNYELPNNCYNETCAAIAFMFWNHRMFLLSGDAKYMDVFERTLYNGFLSGVSLSGDRFFYPNPLEYDGKAANNSGYAGRAPWFGCACCPPNVLRTLSSLAGYFYATRDDKLFVNLYAPNEGTVKVQGNPVRVTQSTEYPWDGKIQIKVAPEKAARFTVCLRVPGWVQGHPVPSDLYLYDDGQPSKWSVRLNGKKIEASPEHGFVSISREWKPGDSLVLDFPMPVHRVSGNPQIAATKGRVALERGPLVYCLEGVDNNATTMNYVLPDSARITPVHKKEMLGGVTVLSISSAGKGERAGDGSLKTTPATLTAIPYAWWNNRGLSPMEVWVARTVEKARVRPLPTVASESKLTVSYHRNGMDPAALTDGAVPSAEGDRPPNFDWWPHKGTREWAQLDFKQPTQVSQATLFWFDDTGTGECRLPVSWKLLYQDNDGTWKEVQSTGPCPAEKNRPVRVTFTPVKTKALRVEAQLTERFSAGLWEWEVR